MQTGHIFISYRLPPLEIFLIIVILWYTHSLTSIPAVKRPGPGSGELWSLMVWNKYVFIRCIISASGLWVVFITLNSIEPYFCGLDCLQWVLLSIYLFYFIDEARIFVLTRNILFFLSFLKTASCRLVGGPGVCSVHVQWKIRDQSSPSVICIHTTLYGNKIKFLFAHHPRNYRPGPSLTWMCCHLCHWSVSCEHYRLYGGCHVTSPLDYYNRKEMTLTRHEADPSTITFTPLGGGARTQRSLGHNWSRRQMAVSNKFTQNNRDHLCSSVVVTPISGNGDIKWCCNTNNGPRSPDTAWMAMEPLPPHQSRLRPGYKGN